MSESIISRFSTIYNGGEGVQTRAKNKAIEETRALIARGILNRNDQERVKETYKQYFYFYQGFYNNQQQSSCSFVYIPIENPKKFPGPHTFAKFSKTNYFIHVHKTSNCMTVGRYSYPLDEEETLETKEALLLEWPGPLDRQDNTLKKKITSYIHTIGLRERERRIRYINLLCDAQRKRILEILNQLLSGNGVIDAKGITTLLLRQEQVEVNERCKDYDKLLRYLLIGQRKEASKYAKSIKLWNHATCLCLLDEFQPPNSCDRINIVQHLEDLINSVEEETLSTVYRALFSRIHNRESRSANFVKRPNVGDDEYKFAILCANDCEMEFDQIREDFKLIIAAKKAISDPNLAYSHMISLGHRHIVRDDDFPSDQSNLSFKQDETHASRTSIISNIDMLIQNEIWEYCLNLARGTCDSENYNYIINLVPYKLIFASKLLDYGLHEMFCHYLESIKRALYKAKMHNYIGADPFYDWEVIERSVEYISEISKSCIDPKVSPQETLSPESIPYHPLSPNLNSPPSQPLNPSFDNEAKADYPDAPQDFPSLPYQDDGTYISSQNALLPPRAQPPSRTSNNIPPPPITFNPTPTIEEVNDFDPVLAQTAIPDRFQHKPPLQHQQLSYNDYSNESSRRPSMDMPVPSRLSNFHTSTSMPERIQKEMTSSSPLNHHKESVQVNPNIADSFNAFSPINQYDDLPRPSPENIGNQIPQAYATSANDTVQDGGNRSAINNNANKNMEHKSQSGGGVGDPQQAGFLANLVGSAKALLPKNTSKQMILPDDRSATIVFDKEKNRWVDTTKPDGDDNNDLIEPPPMMTGGGFKPPASYSAPKTTKSRYPKSQF